MQTEISYHQTRQDGITHITVTGNPGDPTELEKLVESLRGPVRSLEPQPLLSSEAPPAASPALPPTTRAPYFDLGDAEGKPGELVEIPMIGGCRRPMNGFHIGIGLSGYGAFVCEGVILGPFLTEYMKAQGLIVEKRDAQGQFVPEEWVDRYWSGFNMVGQEEGALPTEWCDYAMAFFSIGQNRGPLPSIQIPVETHLFSFQIRILATTKPDVYDLACEDEHFYLQKGSARLGRRRDFLYQTESGGGVTEVDCQGGKLTVLA